MLEIYACTALIGAASLLAGGAILTLLGWPRPLWLAGATGFAALVVLSPFLVRLPGRATTAAIVLLLLLIASASILWTRRASTDRVEAGGESGDTGVDGSAKSGRSIRSTDARTVRSRDAKLLRTGFAGPAALAVAAVVVVLALASLPFFFQDRVGVLGEGIYTNDHAAQLYWADWLQSGFGPEPNAVQFGYPIGPQALTAVVGEATGIDLIAAFNGLLLAIAALTALTALGALAELPPLRRAGVAALAALPYLAASFLAQSAFKETAMALFVLAFAIALQSLGSVRGRAVVGVGLILAAASVFTFSIPGLAWFAIALVLWLALEALAGRSPVDYRGLRESVAGHRVAAGIGLVVVAGIVALAAGPALNFLEKVDDVNTSLGRLGSPIFPGEVFGIWPEGDFRIVRGEVSGALVAAALGGLAALYGAWSLARRRELALLAMLGSAAGVYVGARVFAEIHVEAKALMVAAPLVLLVALRSLLEPDGPMRALRFGAGALVALAALGSTLLALRAAPVGPTERGESLEALGGRIEGDSVVFLGVDRFAGYYLRGTLARAPAGYVPAEVATREEKPWLQGYAVDFDNLDSGKLDKFDYAITTASAYNSEPPSNFKRVAGAGDYLLWERQGPTPRSRILAAELSDIPVADPLAPAVEANSPGGVLVCSSPRGRHLLARGGRAQVRPRLSAFGGDGWSGTPLETAAGGQEDGFAGDDPIKLDLGSGLGDATFELSLQYHSEVPLTVRYAGEDVATLPATLDGMYFDGAGRGAFWPVGPVQGGLDSEIEVIPDAPGGWREAVGVEPRVWLGALAAVPTAGVGAARVGDYAHRELGQACREYVDRFVLARGSR